MIRYTVVWTQSAQEELAELWLIALDPAGIIAAHEKKQAEKKAKKSN